MRHGVVVTAADEPRDAAALAALAEAAGWDGAFTWDAISIGPTATFDPWVLLAAMAGSTERVTLGAIVTPPARRRPWKLAREAMTVDRLSGGRLVLPVGLGALDDAGFGNVGEPTGARERAERLDEALDILAGLWSGEPFAYEGRHHRFGPMTFLPTPVQRPRIPVWVVGAWPHERSMERAARWDGILPQARDADGSPAEPTPRQLQEIVEWVAAERARTGRTGAYDVVAQGTTRPGDPKGAATVQAYRDAGATWWIEADWTGAPRDLRARIAAGPTPG
jgi:alkanesulfonate monooxygenase SsuD/methylene tetrahydromethanopterin reductase-like flavin-dependent oxidoreductase (luciferase family)